MIFEFVYMANLLFFFFIIIPSAIIHEFSHAWVAFMLGDRTAKDLGRLTINPLSHIDFYGTILMPIFFLFISGGQFIFAYAKPVPFNPYNLRNQKYGPALVGAAGPLVNLIVALIFGLLVRFLPLSSFSLFLAVIVYANILLAVLNLMPIPPLDGSRIIFTLLPSSLKHYEIALERMGFLLILIFLFFLSFLIRPIVLGLFSLIVGRSILL